MSELFSLFTVLLCLCGVYVSMASVLQGLANFCETIDDTWDHDPDARLSAGCIRDRLRALQDVTKMGNDFKNWSSTAGAQLPRNVDDVITRLPHNITFSRRPYAPFTNMSTSSTYSGNSSGSGATTMTSSSGGSDASSRYGGAFIGTFTLDEEALTTCVRPLANVTATCATRAPADVAKRT